MIAARAAALAEQELRRTPAERQRAGQPPLPAEPLEALRAVLQELDALTTDRREILAQPAEVVEPEPGQLEILTLHRAKGAEYDAVWLPGLGYYNPYRARTFFPWHLDQAEIWDQAAFVAEQALREHARPSGLALDERTRAAQCLTVAERLRLLYVGVTRAMRELHLSSYHAEGSDPALPHVEAMIAHCERRSP
jgi:DNA helicase-2/ATP-dependent DNA helicase PcrA